jgi:hypothetical protein
MTIMTEEFYNTELKFKESYNLSEIQTNEFGFLWLFLCINERWRLTFLIHILCWNRHSSDLHLGEKFCGPLFR